MSYFKHLLIASLLLICATPDMSAARNNKTKKFGRAKTASLRIGENTLFLAINTGNPEIVKYILAKARRTLKSNQYYALIVDALSHAVFSGCPQETQIIFDELQKATTQKVITPKIFVSEILMALYTATRNGYDTITAIVLSETIKAKELGILTSNQFADYLSLRDEEGITAILWAIKWALNTGNSSIAIKIFNAGKKFLDVFQYKKFIYTQHPIDGWTPYEYFISIGMSEQELKQKN